MAPWWNTRAGKTGMAVKGFPYDFAHRYVVNASSQTSNSKLRTIRRNAWTRTGTSSYSMSKDRGLTVPSLRSCVCPRGRKTVFSLRLAAIVLAMILRTPEACQEISRGLSEREGAQPPVVENQEQRHPERVRGILDTPSGCGFLSCRRIPGVREKRVPLANSLAPLRGADAG